MCGVRHIINMYMRLANARAIRPADVPAHCVALPILLIDAAGTQMNIEH